MEALSSFGYSEEASGDVQPLLPVMWRMNESRQARNRFKPLEMELSNACHLEMQGQLREVDEPV